MFALDLFISYTIGITLLWSPTPEPDVYQHIVNADSNSYDWSA